MRKLTFAAVLLFIVLLPLVIGARFIGSRQPNPEVLTRAFSKADASPCERWCLFGVMPASMSANEVVSTLERHAVTRNMKKALVGSIGPNTFKIDFLARNVLISVDDQGVWVSMSYNNWYTDSQRFSVPDWVNKPVYLGDVISYFDALGDKTLHVNALFGADQIRLTYATDDTRLLFIFELADPTRIQPTDKLVYIGMSERSQEIPLVPRVWSKWHGFTLMERYGLILTN